MTLFTPEDLLRYLYKESSPELTSAIQVALAENWTLREQMEELQTSVNQLDIEKQIVAPRREVVLRVLQYARDTAIETTSAGLISLPPDFSLISVHYLSMTRKQRFDFVIAWFSEHAPEAETELVFDNPYQLLVSVILSAQCTDKRVNLTTPAFFAHFPGPGSLAKAHFDEVFPFIRSISYPNNKTKHLIGMAKHAG